MAVLRQHGGRRSVLVRRLIGATALWTGLFGANAGYAADPAPAADSLPPQQWPTIVRPPEGAPNVIVIMTDDVGFGASSTFGGPVPTPTFDRLARNGLRFNRFHTTAICSASRAALLTGRNHTAVGIGSVTDTPLGYPGHNSVIPPSAATLPDVLRRAGYNTSCFGKWHVTPRWEMGATGPFTHWPTGMGCEKFYGFIQGDTNQWAPALYDGTTPVEPPADDPTYILDRDLADQAVKWMRAQHAGDPKRPFFMYYATGTAHAPHHAPGDWIAKFKGQFDAGWDVLRQQILDRQIKIGVVPRGTKLAPMPDGVASWNSLTPDQRRLYAREMEVFAAALSYADTQMGRLLDELEAEGRLDNTLIIYVQGDNGSSTEGGVNGVSNEVAVYNQLEQDNLDLMLSRIDKLGGPETSPHYSMGWAFSLDTPFRWSKLIASDFGGTRNGMVLSWGKRVKRVGEVRSQFAHLVDIMPTVLEAAGVPLPASVDGVTQQPLNGTSMVYAFDDAKAAERHQTQYFSISGNLAIYDKGLLAATVPDVAPWDYPRGLPMKPLDQREWELFDTRSDFNLTRNLAVRQPEKLQELKSLFFKELEQNNGLPIVRAGLSASIPNVNAGQTHFRYAGPVTRIPTPSAPDTIGRSFSISADVNVSDKPANGMLVTHGGRFGGYGLFVKDGIVTFVYNLANLEREVLRSVSPLSAGNHKITVESEYAGPGFAKPTRLRLMVDGKPQAEATVQRTTGILYSLDETFDVGGDSGTPVSEDYTLPFNFDGTIRNVTVDLK